MAPPEVPFEFAASLLCIFACPIDQVHLLPESLWGALCLLLPRQQRVKWGYWIPFGTHAPHLLITREDVRWDSVALSEITVSQAAPSNPSLARQSCVMYWIWWLSCSSFPLPAAGIRGKLKVKVGIGGSWRLRWHGWVPDLTTSGFS